MICSKCGKQLAEWHFWDADYCQECWEAHCSEEWWKYNVWQNGVRVFVEPFKLGNGGETMETGVVINENLCD